MILYVLTNYNIKVACEPGWMFSKKLFEETKAIIFQKVLEESSQSSVNQCLSLVYLMAKIYTLKIKPRSALCFFTFENIY